MARNILRSPRSEPVKPSTTWDDQSMRNATPYPMPAPDNVDSQQRPSNPAGTGHSGTPPQVIRGKAPRR